jgi:hypothetical protein
MLDPITKHILSEGELEKVDKELGNKEKDIKDIPKDSEDNLKSMKSMPIEEILNRFMFEYISQDDCPPDHTKDPKTGKCSKNPHDEEVDDKSSTMKGGAGKANY